MLFRSRRPDPGLGEGMSLVAAPHHDGSALFVDRVDWRVGGVARVRLRVPTAAGLLRAAVRYTHDGEQGYVPLEREDEQSGVTAPQDNSTLSWWSGTLPLTNPVVSYRFALSMAGGETAWLNATGMHRHDTPDADDFVARCEIGRAHV